tara:strand:- start:302 stop:2011 length:1710 start_codon:yes stop_codon:yes gene_type:complete
MLNKKFINDFKLPIQYIKYNTTNQNIKNDLELINSHNNNSIYDILFKTTTPLGKELIPSFSNYYTTDTTYLKNTQSFIKSIQNINIDNNIINNTLNDWSYIKNDSEFIKKFQYIEFDKFEFLNHSTLFLTLLTILNLFSPLIQLLSPILLLLLPFLIISFLPNNKLTFSNYFSILKNVFKNNSMGKLIFDFNNLSSSQKIQGLVFISFYFFNLYQNARSCYAFYKNQFFIHKILFNTKTYLKYSYDKMIYIKEKLKPYMSYKLFNRNLYLYSERTKHLLDKLTFVSNNVKSFNYYSKPGQIMKYFYTLYQSDELNDLFQYTFGFHGYIELLHGISNNIKHKIINKISFTKKNKTIFKQSYHPSLIKNAVKNNINLKSSKIITGPNASGKTTILKTTIINILLCQQFGYGYFKKGLLNPYDFIHCYINIPDTMSRDSLFQSEARRCYNILDSININKNKRHFCVFDELYSGTNPYEAISSAASFLNYIGNNHNVKFILTTHFLKLCNLFKNHKYIKNYNMKTIIENNKPMYYYKLVENISHIKGGISILKQLNYPEEIIRDAEKIIDSLN